MKFRKAILLTAMVTLLMTGCVRVDIGDRKETPTLGEEIVELYKARQTGAISEAEYQKTRNRLLSLF